ncbi:MAG: kelch repeat-containing protein [Nitrospirota bacterium]
MKFSQIGTRLIQSLCGLLLLTVVTACGSGGGDGGGGTPPAAAPLAGVFVDSPVQGLGYSCVPSGLSGVTNASGQYNYQPGDTVTFSLYGRLIGTGVPASPVVTALTVFSASSLTDPQVINLSQLLLTLAGGPPAAGSPIVLQPTPPAGFPATLDFSDPGFDTAFLPLTLVSEATATTHLSSSFKTLSVTIVNSGSVTSNPAGINCTAGTCSFAFISDTAVTLTATGAGFTGWGGGTGSAICTGTGPCAITVNADSSVTATFPVAPPPATLTILPNQGTGTGTVACSANGGAFGACAASYPSGTALAIHATANGGSTFAGWINGTGNATSCNGTTVDCAISLTANSEVRANFTLSVTLFSVTATTATANGGGGSISCTANGGAAGPCGSYPVGTTMVLTATPNSASNFTGWSGAGCSGTGTCNFTLTANTTVTANFNRPTLTVQVVGTGTVSSNPVGINNCTASCTAPFDKAGLVTLTATGTGFTGWSGGGCTGTGTCVVTLNSSITVTATFVAPPPPMTIGRASHAAARLANGQILITGGFSLSTTPAPALDTAELYDSTTNTFTALTGRMRSARTSHTATLLSNGQVLLTGGQIDTTNGDGNNSAELYDPATQTFTAITATMTVPRGAHVAVLLPDGKVFLAGGFNMGFTDLPVAHNTAELFDPVTQTFTAIAATMTSSRSDHPAAALLPNGQILITGGEGPSNVVLNTAELYDPTTQTFAAITATMTSVRQGHRATLLLNGQVLITGGGNFSAGLVFDTAELFDPTTQTFTAATAMMASPRVLHEATLLPNGTVLLTGGANVPTNSFVVLNTAEVYRP